MSSFKKISPEKNPSKKSRKPVKIRFLQKFEEEEPSYTQALLKTPGVSKFCCSVDWLVSAHSALHSHRELNIWRADDTWLVTAIGSWPNYPRVIQPLEFTWGFACPLIGPSPLDGAELLIELLFKLARKWDLCILGGVPKVPGEWSKIVMWLSKYFFVELSDGIQSMIADISGGAEAYLKRRSAKFRANIRRSERMAQREGIYAEYHTLSLTPSVLLKRILEIEKRSKKYLEGRSIYLIPRYVLFYSHLLYRLAADGRLRILFLKKGEEDIAYVFGGIFGNLYRGFQLSYDFSYRKLGLGHLSQWEMIKHLAEEKIELYDMGMYMDYKEKWTDFVEVYQNIYINH